MHAKSGTGALLRLAGRLALPTVLLASPLCVSCSGPAHRPAVRVGVQLIDDTGRPISHQPIDFGRTPPCGRELAIIHAVTDSEGRAVFAGGAQTAKCASARHPLSFWLEPSGLLPQEVVIRVPTVRNIDFHFIAHKGHDHVYPSPPGDALINQFEYKLQRLKVVSRRYSPSLDKAELVGTLPRTAIDPTPNPSLQRAELIRR